MNTTFGPWHKSSYSYDIGTCLEHRTDGHTAHVRDTENREHGHLTFERGEWTALLSSVR